jgi:hypothetical protein
MKSEESCDKWSDYQLLKKQYVHEVSFRKFIG